MLSHLAWESLQTAVKRAASNDLRLSPSLASLSRLLCDLVTVHQLNHRGHISTVSQAPSCALRRQQGMGQKLLAWSTGERVVEEMSKTLVTSTEVTEISANEDRCCDSNTAQDGCCRCCQRRRGEGWRSKCVRRRPGGSAAIRM